MMRRPLAMVLCMVLCLSMFPTGAVAEEFPGEPAEYEEEFYAFEEPALEEAAYSDDLYIDPAPEEYVFEEPLEEQLPVEEVQVEEIVTEEVPTQEELPEPESSEESFLPAEEVEEPSADVFDAEEPEEEVFLFDPEDEALIEIEAEEVISDVEADEQVETEPERELKMPEGFTFTLELQADNEELMKGFIAEAFYGDSVPDGMGPGFAKKNLGASLKGNNARLYKALKKLIIEVANGERTSTKFSIPCKVITGKTVLTEQAFQNLGYSVDLGKVIGALRADCPYEQYWMMQGSCECEYSGTSSWAEDGGIDISNFNMDIGIHVAKPYAPNGQGGGLKVAPAKIEAVKTAVANAKKIVSNAAGLSDLNKLRRYATKICDLVDYNYPALDENAPVDGNWNNNPWELVWVFDGDSSTKVVCQGYSQAFQYLCDLTKFDRDIACYVLEGDFKDLTSGGGGLHMWNAVTMDNGVNYIIDVTHSDGDNGFNGNVFLLKADSGNPTDGYTFTRKDGTKAFYGYDDYCKGYAPKAARTITLKKDYLPSPILKKATNTNGVIKVTWKAVEGAEKYRVMRKTGSGSWKKIGETTSTSYSDKTAVPGTKYTYTVKAIQGSTVSGYDKTGKSAKSLYNAPELVSAKNVTSGIKVTWKAGTGAAKYQVFRKVGGATSWKKVATVAKLSYIDKKAVAGKQYTYTVRSLNDAGKVISARNSTGISATRSELKAYNAVHTGTIELQADNEELMKGFIAEILYGDAVPAGMGPGLARKNIGGSLKGENAIAYKALKKLVTEVANGERSSTEFVVPDCPNANAGKVMGAIMADCPYEQYWMMAGAYMYYSDGYNLHVSICVAKPYAPSGQGGGYTVDTSKVKTVKKAAANAKSIVSEAAGLDDVEKLRYYCKKICNLVDYNYEALGNTSVNGNWNNNPWEIIWVFDGKESTKVVCEGYSKSFQYLCDLTKFDRNIACYCLEGMFTDSGGGGGLHMWNGISMDNDVNYIIDVTHSDSDSGAGSDFTGSVFMLKADSGNPEDGYYVTRNDGFRVHYGYDDQCKQRTTKEARTITLKKAYLESPLLVKAANTNAKIKVTWKAVEGAEKYRVMRKTGSGSWKKIAETTGTSYTDKKATAGTKYTYTVKAVKGSTVSGYNKTGKSAKSLYKAPELVTAESVSSGIKVIWKAGTNAAKYQVFRKGPGQTSWKKIATVKSKYYTDKNVVSGNKYTYTVRSLNSDGKVISARNSKGVSATCGVGKTLDPPVLSGISNVAGGVKISWKKVTDAAKYRVLRKPSGGSWSKLADTANLTWTDKTAKSGKTYSYSVRCITSDGTKTTSSYDKTGKTITYYAVPAISAISNADGGVLVQWGAVGGVSNYRVLRKNDGGSWATLTDTAETQVLDETAIRNITYSYTVQCLSPDGETTLSGYNTTGKTITSTTGRVLNTPVLSGISNLYNGVQVKWKAVTEAEKYRVFRKTEDGDWAALKDTSALTCTDKTVQSGVKYWYTICCITTDGKSTISEYNNSGKSITYVAAPVISGFSGSAGNLTITWNKVAGAAGYRVLYKTSKSESWEVLADTDTNSYTDTEALNGYYYTIRCLDSSGKLCSSYRSGKRYEGGPIVEITKITNYKDGYVDPGWIDYEKAIYADLSFSEYVSLDDLSFNLEYKKDGTWIDITWNCTKAYGTDGNKGGYCVFNIARYNDAPDGTYRMTANLYQDGTVVSRSRMTTEW